MIYLSELQPHGPRARGPTHLPTRYRDDSKDSLPACRAQLWPGGIRTRGTTYDISGKALTSSPSLSTSIDWSLLGLILRALPVKRNDVDLEAFTDFTNRSLRLMAWYARELIYYREPTVTAHEALDVRVDILRKTTLYDGRHPGLGLDPPNAAWEDLKARLASILKRHSHDEDSSALEDACLLVLWPLVEPTLEDAFSRSRRFLTGPFDCWRFAYKDEPNPTIDLHFANAFAPESPFAPQNWRRVLTSLRDLLQEASRQHPEARSVQCFSWLNQFPPFLAMFPPGWAVTFKEWEYSSGTAGHWGQYMNRRGAFHQRNGEDMRRTGQHPYSCGLCHCPVQDALSHLAGSLAGLPSD